MGIKFKTTHLKRRQFLKSIAAAAMGITVGAKFGAQEASAASCQSGLTSPGPNCKANSYCGCGDAWVTCEDGYLLTTQQIYDIDPWNGYCKPCGYGYRGVASEHCS